MRDVRVADIDKRVARALATLKSGNASRLDYFVAEPDGHVVAASSPQWIDPDASRPWRSQLAPLLAGRARQRGPIRIGEWTALAISTPVPDPDGGEPLGVLVGLLDWKLLTKVLDEVRSDLAAQGIEASLVLVAPDGTPVATSGAVPVALPEAAKTAGFSVDAERQLIVGRAGLDSDVPPWRLLVVEPLDHALAPARALTRHLALTMALALAAALVVATLAARRVVRPLSELTDAIRGMARGDIGGASVPVRSDDEVGVLARSFNQMAGDLDRTQKNLVEAEKFAFVGELAAGVAHEVRTSLGVLRSSAQMLGQDLAGAGKPAVTELVEMIRDEVARLSRVVDDLLTLDRPRALHFEPTPLSLPLLRAAEFVEAQARQKGVHLDVKQADVEAIVSCDREALQHVCVNLLVNAVQTLSEGGHVELRTFGPEAGSAAFHVADDGPGIPPDQRARIFEPFRTGRDVGVGLGLTFVKRVVHEHGGHIEVDASPAGGACFRVEIPLSEETS